MVEGSTGPGDEPGARRAAAEALLACVRRLHARGWCDGTGGNFSIVVSPGPLRLLMTPSGVDKGQIDPEHLVLVGADALPLDSATRPSGEARLHVAIATATGAGAVLHTHSIWGTLLSEHFADRGGLRIRGYEMLKGIDGISSHEDEVFVPVVANSQNMDDLAASITASILEHPRTRGVLIAGHGLYAWGADLPGAHRHIEIYEFLLQLAGRRTRLVTFEDDSGGSTWPS